MVAEASGGFVQSYVAIYFIQLCSLILFAIKKINESIQTIPTLYPPFVEPS